MYSSGGRVFSRAVSINTFTSLEGGMRRATYPAWRHTTWRLMNGIMFRLFPNLSQPMQALSIMGKSTFQVKFWIRVTPLKQVELEISVDKLHV